MGVVAAVVAVVAGDVMKCNLTVETCSADSMAVAVAAGVCRVDTGVC